MDGVRRKRGGGAFSPSPGGTSAEALYFLEKAGFRTALSRAIWAAYQRASQLGRGKKRNVQDE